MSKKLVPALLLLALITSTAALAQSAQRAQRFELFGDGVVEAPDETPNLVHQYACGGESGVSNGAKVVLSVHDIAGDACVLNGRIQTMVCLTCR